MSHHGNDSDFSWAKPDENGDFDFSKLKTQGDSLPTINAMVEGAMREMPKYRSYKTVWALKIKSIVYDEQEAGQNRETDGSAIITPEEAGYAPFRVGHDYLRKHQPVVGGYFVQYKDGYKSFSPADAFKEGYVKLVSTGIPLPPSEEKLGATGEFPDGKITPQDEGAIQFGMAVHEGKLIINFGEKPITWVGLTKTEVLDLIKYLNNKVSELT